MYYWPRRRRELRPAGRAKRHRGEYFLGLPKISRANVLDSADLRAALLPLLPLQTVARLEAVDIREEIRHRSSELAQRSVDAFLSSAEERHDHAGSGGNSVRLAYVDLCGFRGYRKRMRLFIAERVTVIDGRNGVGKSTIFDAVEFALTGELSKYNGITAAGQSVKDYLWWVGDGKPLQDRYVDVGFADGDEKLSVRRTPFGPVNLREVEEMTARLCDPDLAPQSPLGQLCAASIIRDEHIASHSLDLREGERYAFLRDALGVNDADVWIARAARLVDIARRRASAFRDEVGAANADVSAAARRIDEVRAGIVAEETMAGAVQRLRVFAEAEVVPDHLAGPVRERLSSAGAEAEALEALILEWDRVAGGRLRLPELARHETAAERDREEAASALAALTEVGKADAASALAGEARDLIALVALGRKLGLREGGCPLCAKGQSDDEFHMSLNSVEDIAHRLDQEAAKAAQRELARRSAEEKLHEAEENVRSAASEHRRVIALVQAFERECQELGLDDNVTVEQIEARLAELRETIDLVQKDLRILETLRFSGDLERAQHAEADAKHRLVRAEGRFGRARKAQTAAQALHDAARRAAAETLDQRLGRVLPLLSELYGRLRPHPVWGDIEYSIRGDVRRFLRLQVGGDLNPQFLFSSGQRRAAGLAFLLSVNVSLAWSRWRSILLDDPVQHVDDYRAIHVAEVCAQLANEGRQIICAVEDPSLADLLCRRLPFDQLGQAKRVTLGPDADGALAKLSERDLRPLIQRSLLAAQEQSIAG